MIPAEACAVQYSTIAPYTEYSSSTVCLFLTHTAECVQCRREQKLYAATVPTPLPRLCVLQQQVILQQLLLPYGVKYEMRVTHFVERHLGDGTYRYRHISLGLVTELY